MPFKLRVQITTERAANSSPTTEDGDGEEERRGWNRECAGVKKGDCVGKTW